MSPLILHPADTVLLAPQYFGSIAYYATLSAYGHAVVDTGLRYDKRFKSVHRCEIVDTRQRLRLTVPVSKPAGEHLSQWSQMQVSSHAQWWDDHMVSLESAYGRTPFFEFYIDRLRPLIADRNRPITDLDRDLDTEVRSILGLDTDVTYMLTDEQQAQIHDLRGDSRSAPCNRDCRDSKRGTCHDYRRNDFPVLPVVPYYQVRAHKLGFVEGLSILDLIFNMGPESPLILRAMTHL